MPLSFVVLTERSRPLLFSTTALLETEVWVAELLTITFHRKGSHLQAAKSGEEQTCVSLRGSWVQHLATASWRAVLLRATTRTAGQRTLQDRRASSIIVIIQRYGQSPRPNLNSHTLRWDLVRTSKWQDHLRSCTADLFLCCVLALGVPCAAP